jgi:putative PIN family toxin of toxin-antitoxin system
MIHAVVDVNVLVSALVGPLGFSRRTIAAWEHGRLDLITAEGIITELDGKLQLPRIHKRLPHPEANRQWIIQLLRTQARMIRVPLHECWPITGDPEDDYVLATTRLSQAEYLVTGDQGLLDLGEYARARIVSPRQLITALDAEPA